MFNVLNILSLVKQLYCSWKCLFKAFVFKNISIKNFYSLYDCYKCCLLVVSKLMLLMLNPVWKCCPLLPLTI